jgi:group I intron endonuclease
VNYGLIYVATNRATEDQYVGQTRQKFKTRVQAHRISARNPKFKFHKAIASFGFETFSFEEVFNAFDKESLDFAEQEIIKDLSPTYNMTKGGSGMPGPVSDDTRAKRSEDAKRRWANPEWKAKTVALIKKASQTPEFKARCSLNAKSRNLAKIRWEGHVKAEPTPKDIAQSIKDSWTDPVIRAKRIEGLKRAASRPEARQKRSAASKGRVHSKPILEKIAKAKHKPVYCKELECTFLSQKHAAEHFGVGRTAITESIKRKGKVHKQYTLIRVA